MKLAALRNSRYTRSSSQFQ